MLVFFIMVLGLWEASVCSAEPEKTVDEGNKVTAITKQIIWIAIDGLDMRLYNSAAAPNMKGLAMSGTQAEYMIGYEPDRTAEQLFSLVSGVLPPRHGFGSSNRQAAVPTVLNLLEKRKNSTVVFDASGELRGGISGISGYFPGPYQSNSEMVDEIIKYFDAKHPFMSVIVLRGPQAGDSMGQKLKCITEVDNQIGRILNYLHQQGIYEETMLIISGITGRSPLILKGKEFKAGYVSPPVTNIDLVPTIAYLQGLNGQFDGLILWHVLSPSPQRQETYTLSERVKDLSRAYVRLLEDVGRLEKQKLLIKEEQVALQAEKESIKKMITRREQEIKRYRFYLAVGKLIFLVVLLVFLLLLWWQHKRLRRKYLFWD
ncbi:MAG: alkaline phosphatase family protein [Bacillota bacterium]